MLMESARTAIARKVLSLPMREAIQRKLVSPPILDWGCGRGDDVRHLRALGLDAFGFDPHWHPEKPPHQSFAFGHCGYVLNVLRTKEERVRTLQELHKFLSPGALIWVSARSPKDIERAKKPTWVPAGHGYETPKGTYQEGVSKNALAEALSLAGYQHVQTFTTRATYGLASIGV